MDKKPVRAEFWKFHHCKQSDFAMEHTTNTLRWDIETLRCCVCGREATSEECAAYEKSFNVSLEELARQIALINDGIAEEDMPW